MMPIRAQIPRRLFILALAGMTGTSALWSPGVEAHELESDRLTLVLRQDRLIDFTWRGDLPAALHRMLSPQEPYAEFLTRLAASLPPEVDRLLDQARQRWAREWVLTPEPSGKGQWQRWEWPRASQLQAAAQAQLMQRVTGAHEHPQPQSVTAQWLAATGPVQSLKVSVPPALRPLTVVSYRPRQSMVNVKDATVSVGF